MITVEPTKNGILVKVGSPALVVFDGVFGVWIGGQEPQHVGPPETLVWRVNVERFVGVGVVTAMVGNPADRAPFGSAATDRDQNVFNELGPGLEAPVRQQPVVVKDRSRHRRSTSA